MNAIAVVALLLYMYLLYRICHMVSEHLPMLQNMFNVMLE